MTCYYPLLGLPKGLDASVSYFSHTHNQFADKDDRTPHCHQRQLALYQMIDGKWKLRDQLLLPRFGDVTLHASTYGLSEGELIVVVPLTEDTPIEDSTDLLPKPSSKRVDQSPIAERGCLAFHWRGISSSYQGEYPLRMAEVNGGSFLSFDPLLKPDPAAGKSLVILMSISRRHNPTTYTLELFDGTSKEILSSVNHCQNRCTVLDLPAEGVGPGPIVMRGSNWVGIPITIKLSKDGEPASMSVEHAHPPTELFWGTDRFAGSKKIKSSWMGMKLKATTSATKI